MSSYDSINAGRRLVLTSDDIRRTAPSVFADAPHRSASDRYGFIPTREVVAMLADGGFHPTWASQTRVRDASKREVTKHMLRFRHEDHLMVTRGEVPELVLLNSHDCTSGYAFMGGIFRFVCGNGMIVQAEDLGAVRIAHRGSADFEERVIDATYEVMGITSLVGDRIKEWQKIELSPDDRLAYATQALAIRGSSAEVYPSQVLRPRRAEDSGLDLWRTSNVVQENIVRGGVYGRGTTGRRMKTRPVTSVAEDVRVNRKLWALTEEWAKRKS